MYCPFCGNASTSVRDSRPSEDGSAIRRRRYCEVCSGRFTTYEKVQLRHLKVLKKNGQIRPFDREKISQSVVTALRKRQVDIERLELEISKLVSRLENASDDIIPTTQIGEMIMEMLVDLDHVAYVRFASVYKDFRSPKDFTTFIEELRQKTQRT
jgi:transcriptional repressor NrdR